VLAGEPERTHRKVDLLDVVRDQFGLEALRVLTHPLHQRRSLQPFDVAGPVVDIGGRHQLAALFGAGD
jgi:hypothetical protein